MKIIATLAAMAAIATGMVCAAPAYADAPVCSSPPGAGPSVNTPDCTGCMLRHVYDSAGTMRECFGVNQSQN